MDHTYLRYEAADTFGLTVSAGSSQAPTSNQIVVCDNSAWGSILVHQQKRFPGWDFGTRLKSPDFTALGEAYGMPSFRVESTDAFKPALDAALAVSGPALIHLCLDARDVSPYSGAALADAKD